MAASKPLLKFLLNHPFFNFQNLFYLPLFYSSLSFIHRCYIFSKKNFLRGYYLFEVFSCTIGFLWNAFSLLVLLLQVLSRPL